MSDRRFGSPSGRRSHPAWRPGSPSGRRSHPAWRPGSLIVLALGVGLVLSLTGCGRGVSVPPGEDIEADAAACAALTLPDTVLGAARRPTDSEGTAAWGDTPITLRCGVAQPPLAPDSSLLDVGGTAWLPIPAEGGALFVAVNWPEEADPVYVEVSVPDDYAPEAAALADLSGAFAASREATTGG